jgi:hypothetical protein
LVSQGFTVAAAAAAAAAAVVLFLKKRSSTAAAAGDQFQEDEEKDTRGNDKIHTKMGINRVSRIFIQSGGRLLEVHGSPRSPWKSRTINFSLF